MESHSSSKRKWAYVAVALLAILLYPFKSMVVPAQDVLVVTEDMRPIKGSLVRQIWQHYSLESEGHEEDLRTDDNGRVTFAARTIRASLLWRMLGPAVGVLSQGVHAGFGVHTDMLQLGGGTTNSNEHVAPRPGEIVYRVYRLRG